MTDATTPATVHELLLAVAGRVDDDLLGRARELVAVGADGYALDLVTATLIAEATAVPAPVREALVTAARWSRADLDADRALPPPLAEDRTRHRFTRGEHSRIGAALAAAPLDDCSVHVAFRTTPAGAAPGPLPHPVLLVEVGTDAVPEVLTHQLAAVLAGAVGPASVEVHPRGAALPDYHVAAYRLAARVLTARRVTDRVDPPPPDPAPADRAVPDRAVPDRAAPDLTAPDLTAPDLTAPDLTAGSGDRRVDTLAADAAAPPDVGLGSYSVPLPVRSVNRDGPVATGPVPPTGPAAWSDDPLSGPLSAPLLAPLLEPGTWPDDPLDLSRPLPAPPDDLPPGDRPPGDEPPGDEPDHWANEWSTGAWAMPDPPGTRPDPGPADGGPRRGHVAPSSADPPRRRSDPDGVRITPPTTPGRRAARRRSEEHGTGAEAAGAPPPADPSAASPSPPPPTPLPAAAPSPLFEPRPETLARLSGVERELLAQLHAELAARETRTARPDTTNGARAHRDGT